MRARPKDRRKEQKNKTFRCQRGIGTTIGAYDFIKSGGRTGTGEMNAIRLRVFSRREQIKRVAAGDRRRERIPSSSSSRASVGNVYERKEIRFDRGPRSRVLVSSDLARPEAIALKVEGYSLRRPAALADLTEFGGRAGVQMKFAI